MQNYADLGVIFRLWYQMEGVQKKINNYYRAHHLPTRQIEDPATPNNNITRNYSESIVWQ